MKKTVLLFLGLFTFILAAKEYDMNSMYDALKSKYGDLKSVSASIHNPDTYITGTMKAEKGNKYYVKSKNVILVSDGETIWNYSVKDKKVVINSADAFDVKQSIDYVFFSFLTDFTPISMAKVDYGYVLELEFNKHINTLIDRLYLWIDEKNLHIFKIQFKSGYDIQTWEIVNLKLNPKFKAKTFKFKVPKGTEVVDLR